MDIVAFLAEDKGASILATASFMIVFSTVFVVLRYYARFLSGTSFGVGDILIPFAWLAEMVLCINAIIMVKIAYTGRHLAYIVNVDPNKVPEHFKGIMISEVTHPAAVAFPKLVVVLLYLHILTNKHERMAAKILIGLISATWFSYTVAAMFQCTPFSFNWNKTVPYGKCFNIEVYANSSSVPNIITDLAVLILPLRTVWGLKISVGRRVGLLVIFITGSIGIITSIIRTVVFAQTLAGAGPLVDSTYNHVSLINWTIIEPGIYLLSACALSFKPLFRLFAQALHLQAFLTHSKSTFPPRKSHTTTKTATIPTIIQMQLVSGGGKFYQLSEDSEKSEESKRFGGVYTMTTDVASDGGEYGASREFAKEVGGVV